MDIFPKRILRDVYLSLTYTQLTNTVESIRNSKQNIDLNFRIEFENL